MPWGAVAAVAGAAISASAAGDAADAQSEAASSDRALRKEIFDKQTELQEPFRQSGLAATNRLSYLLGLSSDGYGGGGGGTQTLTDDQLRSSIQAELMPRYMTTQSIGQPGQYIEVGDAGEWRPGENVTVPTIDQAGLDAAINAEFQKRRAQEASAAASALPAGNPNDPQFGSLLRDFTMADYQADPGYAFRLSEGIKARERGAAARGGLLSGRAAKDLMRFGQDLGSQEYGNSYNRFQANQGNKFNRLASIAGIGQTATNQVANAASEYGAGASQAIQAGGNARASGYVGSANAINQGIGQGYNAWQQNRLLNTFQQPSSGGWSSGGGYGAGINPYSGEYMGSLEF